MQAIPGADNIQLQWNPNPESNVDSYNLYHSETAEGAYAKLNTELIRDTGYCDGGLSVGDTYYYKLAAVNFSSVESELTDCVYGTVGAVVVWMPDYRGEPGDEVTLLINARNARGISNVSLDIAFTYDASILTPISLVEPGRDTVEKTVLTENLFTPYTSNNGLVDISGLGPEMTITGEGHLFDIKFKVSDGVSWGESGTHIFTEVKFYDINANPLLIDSSDVSLFTVASGYLRGDINGDGLVNDSDIEWCLWIAAGDFVPSPLQMSAGDINGDGIIDAADVVLLRRLVAGLPVNPSGADAARNRAPREYYLTIGDRSGLPGEIVRVPVTINDAAELAGADIRVNYDPAVVTALGYYETDLTSGFDFNLYLDTSWIQVVMSSVQNLASGSGVLVELEFLINPGASPGAISYLTLSQKKLSRQYGENASWDTTLDFDNGSITVVAAATPVPTPTATATPLPSPTLIPVPTPKDRLPWIHDYDGDGTSDIGIFRGTTGLWAIRGITRAYFGSGTDEPVPGDYDGDGTTDVGIYRPASGLWALRGVSRVYFGSSSDEPVPGDYDGTGTWRAGIYRPASGLWAIRGITRTYFGGGDDEPVPGYYAGMVSRNIGIFRPASGLWAIRGVTRVYFGSATDGTVPGDYDGDGSWEAGIFRPSSGLWAARGVTRCYYGTVTDRESPGDYDGDGVDNVGIFRSSSGLWAIKGVTRTYFGSSADIPVTR